VSAARKLLRRVVREREQAFLIEGLNGVTEALRSNFEVTELFVTPDHAANEQLVALARAKGTEVIMATEAVVEAISDSSSPQGLVAMASMPGSSLDSIPHGASFVLVLAAVRDPGNAGTLLRSALAAGADAVIFADTSVDPYGPKAVRASAGALFGLSVVTRVSLEAAVAVLRERGLSVVGTSAGAGTAMDDADLVRPVALVLGNEAWGLPPEASGLLDEMVRIPMPGPAESLNVGIAGSILLFEVVRQRRLSLAAHE
jgi:TrmH family RNA methyltransferase